MNKNILIIVVVLNFSSIFSQNPLSDLYLQGNANFAKGRYVEAIKNYTQLIETVDQGTIKKMAYINRGLSRDKMGKYDFAIKDFTEAIKLDSTDMASFIDRGLSKMHAGYMSQAKKDYKYVIIDNTDKNMMETALYWMARIHYLEASYNDVINYCDEYFKINPRDPELYLIRGTANDKLLNFNQSIIDYSKAIELNSNYYQAYANRGTAKINLLTGRGNIKPSRKKTQDACKDLERAKELGDTSIEDLIFIYCKGKKSKQRK